jgi:hypothetical protein
MRGTGRAISGALLLLGFILWTAPQVSAHQARATLHGQLTWSGSPLHAVAPSASKVRYLTVPYTAKSRQQLAAESAAGTTVQTWTRSVVAGQNGDTYPFTMLGTDVTSTNSVTTVQAIIIPINVTFSITGDVYSSTTANPSCGQNESALTGLLNSPEFKARRWYAGTTFVGSGQYTDAQMREEFWDWTGPGRSSPGWGLQLDPSVTPTQGIEATGFPESDAGTCNELGEIDYTTWDNYLQGTLIPALSADGYITPTEFPIFLVNNVVLTQNSGTTCCIFGYHSSYDNPNFSTNTQTYAWTDYISDGQFGSTTDVAGSSHEIAEWANDPYGNNPTPSWGHTGQDPNSCQNNLEVGDPLTGHVFTVQPTTPGGMAYHLQELTFMGWFFDNNFGVNGWYSTRGTFTSGATLCST